MAAAAVVSIEEYLSTSYRPDCDYIDGEVRERNVGEYDHGRLQARMAIWFGRHERDWRIRVVVEQRLRVSSGRFRIPDVCVIDWNQPIEQVFTSPPLICIEVLSKDDSLRSIRQRVDDYLSFGVPHVWILDPVLRKAYVCTPTGFQEPDGGVLEAAGSSIRVPLSEVFAELDS
jgi:Uma2 family endonuclease